MINEIYSNYGLHAAELIRMGIYEGFWIRNKVYILVPLLGRKEEELTEIKKLGDYMIAQGDMMVTTFVPNVHGYYVSKIQGKDYILVKCNRHGTRQWEGEGRELAYFHYRGKHFSEKVEQLNRIGQWKTLWETRLEQLERFWQSKVINHPNDSFDMLFVSSFPYFLGLTENAIQYIVDTELDDQPKAFDGATVCYQKYACHTMNEYQRVKVPFQWVYDHPGRDIAEWVRSALFTNKESTEIIRFLNEYEQVMPLSSFAWRLMYARLLFPLHYFEEVEGYYSVEDEGKKALRERKLQKIVDSAADHQRFLGGFYDMIQLPIGKLNIRKVEWL
ncbi:spore coat putative kinase YutH [Priestia taiwanensis]|uniref:Spore coat protein YutH n=1 Tax=Priestia taiwanensis TaxID=1347902 RepID=A0A917ERH2_9BACI|nr:spore coat protein YutH [Priestia taiwanensis]MBM7364557.1 spore coat protein YutH [Priestia taiwanensis]GGE80566.1 spore coat protein YutH [Priestia taiwanensis]